MDASSSLILVLLCGLTLSQTEVGGRERIQPDADFSSVSVLGEVYWLEEGDVLHVCCNRTLFQDAVINVSLRGITSAADADFNGSTAVIPPERNCIAIDTVDDLIYERSKSFTVLLTPLEFESKEVRITYSVVLKDDDGPDIECSDKFAETRNLTEIFQQRMSCISSADVHECLDEESDTPVDCTRWNAASASSIPNSNMLFPNINSTCVNAVRGLVSTVYNTAPPIGDTDLDHDLLECFTNCTVTIVDGCDVSVILLEDVNALSISSLTSYGSQIPQQCGIYNITCCMQPSQFPARCFGPGDPAETTLPVGETDRNLVAPIVGGVVGSVVALSCVIVTAVVIGVAVCMTQRKKKREQWKPNPSTTAQSIVYKPKRMVSSASSMTSSTPLTLLESGGCKTVFSSPTTQPNYEEVTYTETYSEWRTKFAKVTIDANHLEYGDIIGEGEFSVVYQAEYNIASRASSIQVAVKNLKNVTEHEEVEKFIKESAIMLDFDHRNILHLVGVSFNTEDNLPAIVLPYMANGDLRTYLRRKRTEMETGNPIKGNYPEGLSEAVLLRMCMDVARGMHYLSKCKFVHRDLAARNCMVDENMVVKVADFGLSRDIHVSDYYRLKHRQRLPVKWMAPESLFTKIYNQKTDVWSFGIVCWEIFKFGKKPYAGIDNPDLPGYISHGFRPKKPSRAPDELFQLMQQTWMEDPQERPDFRAIVMYLANLMKYEGDIENDLEVETKNCTKLRVKPYQQVELSTSHEEPSLAHVYSVLEQPEPVYSNYSREESLDSFEPEEYEVPAQAANVVESLSGTPLEYEIPQSSADTKMNSKATLQKSLHSMADDEMHYEMPSPSHTNNLLATAPVNIPGRENYADDEMHYEMPSPSHMHTSNTAPAENHMADDEIHYEVPSTNGDIVPARYSRLSYPDIQRVVNPESESVPLPNYNTLPSKFSQRVYQTLEPNF